MSEKLLLADGGLEGHILITVVKKKISFQRVISIEL